MNKFALITGINYPNTSYELHGCVNDASAILKKLVNEFEFHTTNIQLLIDEAATKKNILNGLDYLVNRLETGDVGVFTYSGHGTQTTDLPPIDEPDMLDEAIVPIDAITNTNNLIRDDEINEILVRLKPDVHFTVIFDSCNSESGTKDLGKNIQKVRFMEPGAAVRKIQEILGDTDLKKDNSEKGKNQHSFSGINHILLAGCKANESSYENETHTNGCLTESLIRNMKKGITYQELYDTIKDEVYKISSERQHPQLEGRDLNIPIFQ